MMRRAAYLCGVVCSLLLLQSCGPRAQDQRLSAELAAQYDSGGPLDFRKLDPRWTKAYIFAPYRCQAGVDEALGFHWSDFTYSASEDQDDISLVVLVDGNKVISWFDHSRGKGDLIDFARNSPYSRDEAVFTLKRQNFTKQKNEDGSPDAQH